MKFPEDKYILGGPDGHTPVPCSDLIEWARWMEQREIRIVKQETIGHYWISTVFLGLDHNFLRMLHPEHPPILFETMAFCHAPGRDPEALQVQERCSRWDEAIEQHERLAAEFRKAAVG